MRDEQELGFKRLTAENWLQPDETNRNFAVLDRGQPRPVAEGDVFRAIFEPSLAPEVPLEVVRLFEVARGAMLYGWFFYPVFTLALEQLFRVGDAALVAKAEQLHAPSSVRKFQHRTRWLAEQGVLTQKDVVRWEAVRGLRNSSSHPEDQSIYAPGMAMRAVSNVAGLINRLFAPDRASPGPTPP